MRLQRPKNPDEKRPFCAHVCIPTVVTDGTTVPNVIVPTTRFGDLETTPDRALDFGSGLLGFPDARRYYVVEISDDEDYFWLQSGDLPELAFLVTRPWAFFPDYEFEVPEPVTEQLGLADPADSEVFLVLTVQRDGEVASAITANLLGPIVVNTVNRKACQLVLDDAEYGTSEPLVAA